MKSPLFGHWGLGITLTVLPLVASCLAENPEPGQQAPSAGQTQAETTATPPVEIGNAQTTNNLDIADAPVRIVSEQKTLPPSIRPERPVAEIIKLANSGVEQSVMMAFVTNNTSTFNLSAEEIIYLKDIGVPDPVVTAMIFRDQTLRQETASALAAAAPPPIPADEPNPPSPAEVAPQPDASSAAYPPEPPPAEQVATDANFYGSLAPYGNWVDVGGYGLCWQPTVMAVNPGWQPYYNCGRWVFTDCGWYWVSDYSWGWAPFHYGRWFQHNRLGWCWQPDTVWGPSWVSWRYTDNYCGWAPLPPGAFFTAGIGLTFHGRHVDHFEDCGLGPGHYRFVAWNHFHDRDFQHYRLGATKQDQVFRESLVATRFTGRGDKISNEGLPPQKVAAATGTQVRRVALRESTSTTVLAGRTERFAPDNRTLTVYRPSFGQPSAASAPSATRAGSVVSAPRTKPAPSAPSASVDFAGTGQYTPGQTQVRPGQNPPLILRGAQTSAVRETPPASSLVIIGRRDPNGTRTTYSSTVPAANAPTAPVARSAAAAPSWTGVNRSSATPWADTEFARDSANQVRPQTPAAPAAAPNYRSQGYSPRNNNNVYGYPGSGTSYRPAAPAYQAPARNAPANVPRYTPAAPQRSYSAPTAPAPAPARPAPQAPPAPSQSSSRGQR